MSDSLNPLGSFYAVCISNPPMILAGTIGRTERQTKVLYMSSVLSIGERALYDIHNNYRPMFDSMWDNLLSSSSILIRSFEAPDVP